MPALDKLHVQGFKSIRDQEIELRALNVLIGANGSGKSNLLEVFHLLNRIVDGRLQLYVGDAGGADSLLHFGRKTTKVIELEFFFGRNGYSCKLLPTAEDSLVFGEEKDYFHGSGYDAPYGEYLGSGHLESRLPQEVRAPGRRKIAHHVVAGIKGWRAYHFHDTSDSAAVKQTGDIEDNTTLRADAGNLAAFLYRLQETDRPHYDALVGTIRLAAPFFDDFALHPTGLNPDKIRLRWRDKGSDGEFSAAALSDGTLRFICLAALLLQPDLPSLVILDEPELGLHPYAINLLADLLYAAATRTQVIVSTQSVTLVNQLGPEDILVADRKGDESVFRRFTEAEITSWLDDYSLGELWEKNVLGGRPGR
jgi:predicted ATPase